LGSSRKSHQAPKQVQQALLLLLLLLWAQLSLLLL
jgi:hypothetical protein